MKRLVLLAVVLLAFPLTAQTPLPRALLNELPVAAPRINPVPFGGFSAVTGHGSRFVVITTATTITGSYSGGTTHGMRELDQTGTPMQPPTRVVGHCGSSGGVGSDGTSALAVWGCLGETQGSLLRADGTTRTLAVHARTREPFGRHDFSGIRKTAWDGEQYVVDSTLETYASGIDPLRIDYRAIATRVSASGDILQNDIDLGPGYAYDVAAREGLSVVVIGRDGLIVRTINSAGIVSESHLVAPRPFTVPAIAAGTEGFLVVWSDESVVYAQHLDVSGRPDAPRLLVASEAADSVAVTAEGSGYRVAWSRGTAGVRAARIVASALAGPAETVAEGFSPALAANGGTTMLVWSGPEGTRARPIDEQGSGHRVHALLQLQGLESIAMTTSGVAIAWQEGEASRLQYPGGDVIAEEGEFTHLRGLDRALIIEGSQPPFLVRYADAPETAFQVPSRRLFWTGDGFLAVWSGVITSPDPFTPLPLLVQRFDAAGNPIDASPRNVGFSLSLDAGYSGSAALYNGVFAAASDHEILIAYADPSANLQGVIIRGEETIPIGVIADPQALANPIQITSDGQDFLVTWISNANTIHSYIGSRRVLAGGVMPEQMRVQTTAGTLKERMATFWTGEHYLVVWSSVIDFGIERTISAIRIARDGTLMDYPERTIGSIEGYWPQFAYRNGALAVAYGRDGRVWWRYAGTPRRRSVAW